MDSSPLGFSVHGILQARILEWVAMHVSRGSSRPRDQTQVSCAAGRLFTIRATREVLRFEKTDEHGTYQMTKANTAHGQSFIACTPDTVGREECFPLGPLPPQVTPVYKIPVEGYSVKHLSSTPQNSQGHQKQAKLDMITKCNMRSWLGSWNTKRY